MLYRHWNDKGCDYSNTEIAYNVSELGYENCVSETVIFGKEALQQNSLVNKKFLC